MKLEVLADADAVARAAADAVAADADVALTGIYQGRRRMTLAYPVINRARRIIWVVTGSDKAEALRQLLDGDVLIAAGRISRESALVLADRSPGSRLTAEHKQGG
jgi:6-phosphogluconolactonase